MGFFCSVHCKLERLNYSSLVAVIKYGDRSRDARSAELPELLRLQSGSNGKRGSETGPDPIAADGGKPGLLHCINTISCRWSLRWSRGKMSSLFSACVFAFLPRAFAGGRYPAGACPGLGAPAVITPQVGNTRFRAV